MKKIRAFGVPTQGFLDPPDYQSGSAQGFNFIARSKFTRTLYLDYRNV